MVRKFLGFPCLPIWLLFFAAPLYAQGWAFQYQGQLRDAGSPANGSYDFRFAAYDDETNGNQVGFFTTNAAVVVTNGMFNTAVDFNTNIFTGIRLWLELAVRTAGETNFTALTPRQALMPVPYAIFASSAGELAGTPSADRLAKAASTNQLNDILLAAKTYAETNTSFLAQAAVTRMAADTYFPVTNSLAFADRMRITDTSVRNDLIGFENELLSAGISFNTFWADMVLLNPRFNPTNNLSWNGVPLSVTNLGYSGWGGSFSNSTLVLSLSNVAPSNTLVLVVRGIGAVASPTSPTRYLAGMLGVGSCSEFIYLNDYASWFYTVSNGIPYPNSPFFNTMSVNTLQAIGPGGPLADYSAAVWPNRMVLFISNDGDGNYTAWYNGMPATFGGQPGALSGNNAARLPGPWNQLWLGDYTGMGDPNSKWLPQKYSGQIAFAGVVNCSMTTNLAITLNRALRWLEPQEINRIWIGDSRLQTQMSQPHYPWSPTSWYGNSPAHNDDACVFDLCQSGTKIADGLSLTNFFFVNGLGGKVKRVDVYCNYGLNDIWGNWRTPAAWFWPSITNFVGTLTGIGQNVYYLTAWDIWTNASFPYAWDAICERERTNLNNLILSNRLLFTGVIDANKYVTQAMLDTNNGYSGDGLHFNPGDGTHGSLQTVNGWQANQYIAELLLNPPPVNTDPSSDASSLSNLNASSLSSGTVPDARLSPRITSFGTNVLTSIVGDGVVLTTNAGGISVVLPPLARTNALADIVSTNGFFIPLATNADGSRVLNFVVTNINAATLGSGTMPDGRLSGITTNITGTFNGTKHTLFFTNGILKGF